MNFKLGNAIIVIFKIALHARHQLIVHFVKADFMLNSQFLIIHINVTHVLANARVVLYRIFP
jgi:hypothetical protein